MYGTCDQRQILRVWFTTFILKLSLVIWYEENFFYWANISLFFPSYGSQMKVVDIYHCWLYVRHCDMLHLMWSSDNLIKLQLHFTDEETEVQSG